MLGLMQDWPLVIHRIIDHAARSHGDREIFSRSVEGPFHRISYRNLRRNALRVSQALDAHGISLGDRVGTLAWNTWRHMEVWYGLTGIGAIYHTVNPRLFPDQIAYIINHAEDRLLFVDLTFVPLVEALADRLATVEAVVVLTDTAHMPETSLPNVVCYEDWIGGVDGDFAWRELDENTAAGMCYTSGTTGNPKGVVYSHRSNVLHSLAATAPDMLGVGSRDNVMPVVPMFHANGWSLAFSCPMMGAGMVMPGGAMDGASIYEMLEAGNVTVTAAVPTVWSMLLQYMETENKRLSTLKKVIIGGSACPRAMTQTFQNVYGVDVIHAWGMTEMSPLGSLCTLKPAYAGLVGNARLDIQEKQGFAPFTVEMKITDDDGRELPWDGKTFGRLKVRGPAISKSYFRGEGGDLLDAHGYFDTGDVATMDPQAYMHITDRAKDVIKSGGEWISSIEVENAAMGHPDVAEAAVIGIAHPKWGERPLLIVVLKDEREPDRVSILDYLTGKIAKWWLPDDVTFVDGIPHTATGKIQKTALRKQFADYQLPSADAAE